MNEQRKMGKSNVAAESLLWRHKRDGDGNFNKSVRAGNQNFDKTVLRTTLYVVNDVEKKWTS